MKLLCRRRTTALSILFGSAVRCSASTLSPRARVTLFYNDVYEVVLPATHGFPMSKYRLVREGCVDVDSFMQTFYLSTCTWVEIT